MLHNISRNGSSLLTSWCLFVSNAHRNSSTKDLTQFAADAIAFNRQLSQHEEECGDASASVVCSMKLSPPSNSRLARRRAQSNALRARDFLPTAEEPTAWEITTHTHTYSLQPHQSLLSCLLKNSTQVPHPVPLVYSLLALFRTEFGWCWTQVVYGPKKS